MPRGVPASGVRKPRHQAPPLSVAAGPVDEPAGDQTPADVPTPDAPPPVVELVQFYDSEQTPPPAREPVPGDELLGPTQPEEPPTPEQEEIRYLRHQLAQLSGKKDVEPEPDTIAEPGSQDNIVIHFLEDGLTALGKVWYRGQELEFEPGSRAYQDTFDRYGNSWLKLA